MPLVHLSLFVLLSLVLLAPLCPLVHCLIHYCLPYTSMLDFISFVLLAIVLCLRPYLWLCYLFLFHHYLSSFFLSYLLFFPFSVSCSSLVAISFWCCSYYDSVSFISFSRLFSWLLWSTFFKYFWYLGQKCLSLKSGSVPCPFHFRACTWSTFARHS